jgi:hypothetical protein
MPTRLPVLWRTLINAPTEKGVALVWRVGSVAEARKYVDQLLFSQHGLITVDLAEIAEF